MEKVNEKVPELKTSRHTGLELLRIVSMAMIILGHIVGPWQGWTLREVVPFSFNYYTGWLVMSFVVVGTNCFALLSGYFMCESSFRPKKLILLWLETFLYSAGIYSVVLLLGATPFKPIELFAYCLPFSSNRYWFISTYVLLMLLSPILNWGIRSFTKRQHQYAIAVSVGIFSIWVVCMPFRDFSKIDGGFSLLWFFVLYLIAAYLKRYYKPSGKSRIWMLRFLALGVIVFLLSTVMGQVIQQALGETHFEGMFGSYNSIFVLAESICLFLFFINLSLDRSRAAPIIRYLAPLSLGVYILHMHNESIYLWRDALKPYAYANSPWMLPYALFCMVLIYLVCVAIDSLRSLLFRPLERTQWLEKLSNQLTVEAWMGRLDRLEEKRNKNR